MTSTKMSVKDSYYPILSRSALDSKNPRRLTKKCSRHGLFRLRSLALPSGMSPWKPLHPQDTAKLCAKSPLSQWFFDAMARHYPNLIFFVRRAHRAFSSVNLRSLPHDLRPIHLPQQSTLRLDFQLPALLRKMNVNLRWDFTTRNQFSLFPATLTELHLPRNKKRSDSSSSSSSDHVVDRLRVGSSLQPLDLLPYVLN